MRLSGSRKARRQVFLLAMKELSFSKVQRPISLRHRSLVSDDCVFRAGAKPGPACACWTDARKRIVVNYHTSCAERHNHRSQVTPGRESTRELAFGLASCRWQSLCFGTIVGSNRWLPFGLGTGRAPRVC